MASGTSRTIRVNFDGDTKGLANAAKQGEREVDKFGKSVDKKFRKSGDDSGKGFASGLRKWLSPSALSDLRKSGEFGGTLFGSGLLGAIKTPVLGPAIIATLGAVVATALPAIGAIAGTGLVAGFGVGLAGLGLTFAAKSQVVKDTWSKTLADMGKDMQVLSRPFESTLISMAGVARRTFATFKPELDKAFKLLAPTLTTFGDELGRAFEKLAPAIQPLASAASTVLRTLGPALQSVAGQTAQALTRLANSVKENPDALADMVKGVGDLTTSLINAITTLNNVNGAISKMTGGVSAVDATFKLVQAGTFVLTGTIQALGKVVDALSPKYEYFNENLNKGYDSSLLWTQGLTKAQLAAMGITGAAGQAGAATESLTDKFNRQKSATDALIQSTFRLQNLALGLSGAQINLHSAIDSATASIASNGRTLNLNTEKGRANRTALNQVAQAANAQTQAMIESGKGIGAASQSAAASRSNFVALAQKMGLSKKEAQALATELIGIPAKKNTNVSVTGAGAAKGSVDALGRSIDNLKNKVVTVTYKLNGIERTQPSNVIGSAGRASGGLVQPRRTYLVGERGPEYLTMGGTGGRITSNERLGSAAASAPIVVENHIEIGGEVVRVVRTEIKADNANTKRRANAGVRAA